MDALLDVPMSVLTATVLLALAIFCFIWYTRRNDNYWKERGIPYAPRASYFAIIKLFMTKRMDEMISEQYQKYGTFYGGFEGSKPVLTVSEPEILRRILVKDFHAFSARRSFDFGDDVVNKMVTVLQGDDWKRVRTLITPAFTSKKMRRMTNLINDCVQTVLKTFDEHASKGTAVDCKKILGTFTMDAIATTAFATKIDSHHDPENPFAKHAREVVANQSIIRLLIILLVPPKIIRFLRLPIFDRKTLNFFRDVTLQVIEERKQMGRKGNDFLQLMMDALVDDLEVENPVNGFKMMDFKDDEQDQYGSLAIQGSATFFANRKLTQNETLAQCIIFFMVGYETTAATLSYIAYNLALNPECQEKLIREVDEAFEKCEEMTYEVVREMSYLDAVISETLRMYPPLLVTERVVTEDYKIEEKGITLPKGMVVKIPIYPIHYDPRNYPEPKKFDPERFTSNTPDQYTYLPFGAGPRNCLGMRFALMEIKLCISNLLRHFRFRKAPETKDPLEFIFGMGFLSVRDLPLMVEKRTDVKH